jgi:TonB family protein
MQSLIKRFSQSSRRRMIAGVLVLPLVALFAGKPAQSQTNDDHQPSRKIVTRVEAEYPETLRRLFIGGMVRVEVVITPAGTVDGMELLGGNPILGQSAMKAIKQWRFAPGPEKTRQVVQLGFDPHE